MKRSAKLDAIDLFAGEAGKLRELRLLWTKTEPDFKRDHEIVPMQFEHGTVGKLLLRHGAIYLAATEHLTSALDESSARLAGQLAERSRRLRPMLDEIDELNRHLSSVWVLRPAFVAAVNQLCDYLDETVDERTSNAVVAELRDAVAAGRVSPKSAKFIVKHAPTHPGRRRWYHRFGPVERVHALYDRVRACPSEKSTSWSDADLAHRFAPRTNHRSA